MHLSRTVPIPFLRGKPMVSFGALTFKEAQHLTHEEWLRADLLHSRSNELPLSDGKAKLTARLSTPEEKEEPSGCNPREWRRGRTRSPTCLSCQLG